MKAETKVLARRLVSGARGKVKAPMERFPEGNSSAFHLWLEMLRTTSLETGDSGSLEKRKTTPSDSPMEV